MPPKKHGAGMSAMDISTFLSGLTDVRKSRGRRALIAQVIKENKPIILEFVAQKRREARDDYADHLEGLVKQYETAPKGVSFNTYLSALRYHASRIQGPHFTVKTDNSLLRSMGYAFAIGLMLLTLYGGCVMSKYLPKMMNERAKYLEEIQERVRP